MISRLRAWLQRRVERQTRAYIAAAERSVSPSNVRRLPSLFVCRTCDRILGSTDAALCQACAIYARTDGGAA